MRSYVLRGMHPPCFLIFPNFLYSYRVSAVENRTVLLFRIARSMKWKYAVNFKLLCCMFLPEWCAWCLPLLQLWIFCEVSLVVITDGLLISLLSQSLNLPSSHNISIIQRTVKGYEGHHAVKRKKTIWSSRYLIIHVRYVVYCWQRLTVAVVNVVRPKGVIISGGLYSIYLYGYI